MSELLKDVTLKEIMVRAMKKKIVIPAFNVAHLPMTEPMINALKKTHTFALIEVSRPDYDKFGAKSLEAVEEEYRKYEDRNFVRLHQDHVPAVDEDGKVVDWRGLIQKALNMHFDSVMIDASRLSFEDNIKTTAEVVKMAHAQGVPVESELGAVLGHEKGPIPPYEELFKSGKGFTDIEEAKRFVKESGVDWLSVAVGNIHGAISGAAKDAKKLEARLNVEHIKKLSDATGVPLVLHGGSGVRQEYVLDGIKNGLCKINVGTEVRQAYEAPLREKPGNIKYAQDKLEERMVELIRDYYRVEGSADKLSQ